MTIKEAIQFFEDDCRQCRQRKACESLEKSGGSPCRNIRAIAALRAQQERENSQPLTLEELRRMNGQSVWCATSCGTFACIVQIKRHRDDCGDITLVHDVNFTFTPEGNAIYRTKPKDDAHD